MTIKFSQLVTYFENLAAKHVDIGHTDTEKHFFRMEIDEVLAGINRTDVKTPFLILEGYGFGYTDNKSDNLLKNRDGAFILLDHVKDITDYDALHDAWDRMEEIGEELIMKMKADKRNPLTPVIRDFNFDSVQGTLIANDMSGHYGIRFTYSLVSPRSTDINPEKWLSE